MSHGNRDKPGLVCRLDGRIPLKNQETAQRPIYADLPCVKLASKADVHSLHDRKREVDKDQPVCECLIILGLSYLSSFFDTTSNS